MAKRESTETESRLDRARRPVSPSVPEWVMAAMGLAGVGAGISVIRDGDVAGGILALIIGVAFLAAFTVILLRRKRG